MFGLGSARPPRQLAQVEVWLCQGRSAERWAQLTEQGHDLAHILAEGSKATGGQTASALVLMAGYIMGPGSRAGGCGDDFDDLNIAKLLEWLRRSKRGLFPQAFDECRAGAPPRRTS